MKRLIPLFLILSPVLAGAQNIDLAHLDKLFGKGNPIKISGGLSASGIYYTGNDGSGRAPFTWFLNGNLNVNILGKINMPFSFSLTNVSSAYTYPSLPNRLSLTPTYK